MFTRQQRKLIWLSSLGGILEFYDFIIYAVLAGYIAQLFFKTGNNITSLMATFASFSIGYLARPLGGIICGHLGDRVGRKKVFTISILLMAIATFAIGLVPSYAKWGIIAPITITLLRILQGLSVGGEIPGAIVYISEAIQERKGLACGVIFGCLIFGIALGLFTQAILGTLLTNSQMLDWGWRLPFFIGGIFGLGSFFLRLNLEESNLFKSIEHKVEQFPIMKVFHERAINTLAGVFIVSGGAVLVALLFLFTPSYVSNILKIHSIPFIWSNTVAVALTAVLCPVFGFFSDYTNKKIFFSLATIFSIILAYPMFYIYSWHFNFFWLALLFSALLTAWVWGYIPSMLSELFPTKIRYSGIAIIYNLSFAIFGGLTPLISTMLIYGAGSNTAPCIYVIIIMLCSLLAVKFTKHSPLHHP